MSVELNHNKVPRHRVAAPRAPVSGTKARWEQAPSVAPASRGEEVTGPAAFRRLFFTGLWFGLLALSTYFVPQFSNFRPWVPGERYTPFPNYARLMGFGPKPTPVDENLRSTHARLVKLAQETPPSEPTNTPPPSSHVPSSRTFPPYERTAEERESVLVAIENPDGLAHYFLRLTLAELGEPGVIARAAHIGDSVLGDDGLSFAIRKRLQLRFGDAGHGFHVLAPFNTGYLHRGVKGSFHGSWQKRCEILFRCEKDGRYGLGGTSSRAWSGAFSRFATMKEGIGSRASRFELWYARMPDGGQARVKVDGAPVLYVQSQGEDEDVREIIEVSDDYHEFEVETLGGGTFRGYGVVLERSGPGVTWDGLSTIGAFTSRFDAQNADHIAGQVRDRALDLIVFLMGGNDVQREASDLKNTMEPFENDLTRVVRKYRAGRPQASCLIMSPGDHGVRSGGGAVKSRPIMPRITEAARHVAFTEGCAFFDTLAAMGGPGAVARWVAERPPWMSGDLAHPTSRGHEVIASVFHGALMRAYARFREEHAGKPLELTELDRESAAPVQPRPPTDL